jgi:amino acid transporter
LVIGITIGSGIFRTPAVIAARVPDPTLMLAVWVLGGLISLCGALSVAELAAPLPQTGGWYIYLRTAWGRLAGFLFGWSELVLIRASATGAVATVFSEYLQR